MTEPTCPATGCTESIEGTDPSGPDHVIVEPRRHRVREDAMPADADATLDEEAMR